MVSAHITYNILFIIYIRLIIHDFLSWYRNKLLHFMRWHKHFIYNSTPWCYWHTLTGLTIRSTVKNSHDCRQSYCICLIHSDNLAQCLRRKYLGDFNRYCEYLLVSYSFVRVLPVSKFKHFIKHCDSLELYINIFALHLVCKCVLWRLERNHYSSLLDRNSAN